MNSWSPAAKVGSSHLMLPRVTHSSVNGFTSFVVCFLSCCFNCETLLPVPSTQRKSAHRCPPASLAMRAADARAMRGCVRGRRCNNSMCEPLGTGVLALQRARQQPWRTVQSMSQTTTAQHEPAQLRHACGIARKMKHKRLQSRGARGQSA